MTEKLILELLGSRPYGDWARVEGGFKITIKDKEFYLYSGHSGYCDRIVVDNITVPVIHLSYRTDLSYNSVLKYHINKEEEERDIKLQEIYKAIL